MRFLWWKKEVGRGTKKADVEMRKKRKALANIALSK
ncbi:unnamed protein product [Nezara viridula]|uniref:Uncharacterized protein n=1 Tax=Nezara viridula TaxID=85310 RepID=A0A9P0MUY7_NEZVI|nr:unnamed protein product [Nezara viridula]